MSDIDNDLQQRLKRFSEEIQPQPGRGAEIVRAARGRRRLVALGAGFMTIVLIGGVAGAASLLGDRKPIDPAPNPGAGATFARYFFEAKEGNMSASGVLEVNSGHRTICLEAMTSSNIIAGHLIDQEPEVPGARDKSEVPESTIALSFFDPNEPPENAYEPSSGIVCLRDQDPAQLQQVIDDPVRFALDFHGRRDNGSALVAQLRSHLPDATVRCDFPTIRPSYLPWLNEGERPGPPVRSYDEEIDRAQLSWRHTSGANVGLTVYPEDLDSTGEPIGVEINGVEGHLHRGEATSMSVSWDLDARCDLLELAISLPGADQNELKSELLKVARSLVMEPDTSSCSQQEPPQTTFGGGLRLQPTKEGTNEVVPIVFPDGTTAELVYPSELSSDSLTVAFDELLARPYPAGGPRGRMIRPQIFYDGIPAEYEADTMVGCIQGRNGGVPVWDSNEGELVDLVFGRWHVLVFDGRRAQQVWARQLRGEVVKGGWLVLRGGDDLFIGPENDPGDANLMLTLDNTILNLWVLDCEDRQKSDSSDQVGEDFISYCLENVDIEVHVQGAPEFAQSVYEHLEVRNVKRAFPLSSYTLLP